MPQPAYAKVTEKIRVLRAIARMNVGGPAHHVSILGGHLDPARFESLLVTGSVGPGEGSARHWADEHGAMVVDLPTLGPEIRPVADLRAFLWLRRTMRERRPDILHTHTGKAGLLGRLAAVSLRRRPCVVHTYHGHVLEGYFGPLVGRGYRLAEKLLALSSDVLIAVSEPTADDLVRLGVAPREKFRVIRLGLDLDELAQTALSCSLHARRELALPEGELVLLSIGRLIPIKRLDVAIRGLAGARRRGVAARLVIAGDGPSRPGLEQLVKELGLHEAVTFLGFRADVGRLFAAADVALLTSDNEGTPVALIEASAAGRPSIATAVGGVPDVLRCGAERLVAPGDHEAIAQAITELVQVGPEARRAMGEAARADVLPRFGMLRLIEDMQRLYIELVTPGDGAGA